MARVYMPAQSFAQTQERHQLPARVLVRGVLPEALPVVHGVGGCEGARGEVIAAREGGRGERVSVVMGWREEGES